MKNPILLVSIALSLVACGGGGQPQPADPQPPQTQTFTGRGLTDLPSVPASASIVAGFGSATQFKQFTVGTLKTDKTVDITIGESVLTSAPSRTLATDKSASACDNSAITVKDAEYKRFNIITFAVAGQGYGAQMGTKIPDNGIVTSKTFEYWYANQEGSYVGTSKCGTRTITWDVKLSPGWNKIYSESTYDAATFVPGNTSKTVSQGANTSYNGPWTTYKIGN